MTNQDIIEQAVAYACKERFIDPEHLKTRIISHAAAEPRHSFSFKRTVLLTAIALLAVAMLTITAVGSIMDWFSMPVLAKFFAINPIIISEQGESAVEPYICEQMKHWNFYLGEQGKAVADVDAIMQDYQKDKLTIAKIYEIYGKVPPSVEQVYSIEEEYPQLRVQETYLKQNKARYEQLLEEAKNSGQPSNEYTAEDAFILEYNMVKSETDQLIAEISQRLIALERQQDHSYIPKKKIPRKYRLKEGEVGVGGYVYYRPFGERDGIGQLIPHYLPEKEATGECVYDGKVRNTKKVYDFVLDVEAKKDAYLIMYGFHEVREFVATKGAIVMRLTEYFSDGTGKCIEKKIDSVEITKDFVFICHFTDQTQECYELKYEPVCKQYFDKLL